MNRGDMEMFSLKISTIIKRCLNWDTDRKLELSLFLSALLIESLTDTCLTWIIIWRDLAKLSEREMVKFSTLPC